MAGVMALTQIFSVDRKTEFVVACSGGVDSMAVCDFYHRGGKNFKVAYFNHGTPLADSMQRHVQTWCNLNTVRLSIGNMPNRERPKKTSPEEWWRECRYNWLQSLGLPIVTAHHLNDVAETWIFTSLHGEPRLILAHNQLNRVFRPFLLNTKAQLTEWCVRHGVAWVEDLSNQDVHFPRNRIRNRILPECLEVNPGLLKVLKKKYFSSDRGVIS